jgi:hypothetical protein
MKNSIKVTSAALTGAQIKSLIDGESKPINMMDGEAPCDFLSRIYNEMAADKINSDKFNRELLTAIQSLLEIYDCQDGRQWTTLSKRRALDDAHAAVNKALGETK